MADIEEFVPFRFKVSLFGANQNDLLCAGYFSEVTGFELTMEPKVIKEGGRNWGEHQRSGPTKFAPLVLKRGVTSVSDLWTWFDITTRQHYYGYRMSGEVVVLGNPTLKPEWSPGQPVPANQVPEENPLMTWKLTGVLPTKFKGPDLSSTASQVAIEELHLVHEGVELVRKPAPAGG